MNGTQKSQLARFDAEFSRDLVPMSREQAGNVPKPWAHVLQGYGGASFRGGLYRIAAEDTARSLDIITSRMWPEYSGTFASFGFDWRGRIFSVRTDSKRSLGDVMLFEPGSGDCYEIPANLVKFHNEELVDYPDETLSSNLFEEWSSSGGVAPSYSKCIGYRVPLFLNGGEDVTNLEPSELEIYLEICAQLWAKANDLPDGTRIAAVTIDDGARKR